MNRRGLLYFVAFLLAFLIIVPGMSAADTSQDGYKNVSVCKAKKMIEKGEIFILDVRTQGEFDAAYIEGATLIPVKKELGATIPPVSEEEFLNEVENSGITKDKPVLIYCLTGSRSVTASTYLANGGYTVYNMEGGIKAWIDARYSVVSSFVDVSGVDDIINQALDAQINCVFFYLKMGDDLKANEQLEGFIVFVDFMEQNKIISSSQAKYLISEANFIKKMI
ncbi:rhodanese-like domain-containing protein [Methanosarcina hadiensis]|uniref:rhodanese-like domain-containing protein n=1 Tax=Methanosarcina hadiensis TaxID=3078083 RepID=UPI0039772801